MNTKVDKIRKFRIHLLEQVNKLTTEQVNTIPPAFNNNVIWNIGHMIAVQQNLCYLRAGQPITVPDNFVTPFLPGTKPTGKYDTVEIHKLFEVFISSLDQLDADLSRFLFENYSPSAGIQKIYGIEVTNVEQALEYLLHHEGLHYGKIQTLIRFLT